MKFGTQSAIFLSALFLAPVIGAHGVFAGPAGDAATRAENLLASGEILPAYSAFDTAQHAFWQASPLAFRKAILVNRAGTFGDYDIRDDAAFDVGETMMIYVEPVGFDIGSRDGQYQIGFNTDFAIETSSGTVLARKEDLFSVNHKSRSKNRDFNMNLSLIVPALKPGAYVSVFTIKDSNSVKSGELRVPFNIRSQGVN